MHREDFAPWARRHGYTQDTWGNWRKTISLSANAPLTRPFHVRFKLKKLVLCKEVKSAKVSAEWHPVWSAYYGDVRFVDDKIVRKL